MLHNPTGKERLALAFLLGMLAILGPLNIDMYLPSFPEIADDLSASASLVQLSLTACLVGLTIGQLIVGPVSDAQGRRKPLLICIFLFALSSLFCALSPNITTLVAARFLQGFTASAGLVLSRAIVRDVFTGRELSKFFSLLMVITAVAPMVAPMTGGAILLLPFATWHTIFHVLTIIGFLLVLLIAFRLKETLPPENRIPSSIGTSVKTMGSLLKDRSFMGYALTVGFIHGEALHMYPVRLLYTRISMECRRRCLVFFSALTAWRLYQAALLSGALAESFMKRACFAWRLLRL